MAGAPRPAQRAASRGYSGYDRHGNYDPYGDLLRFSSADTGAGVETGDTGGFPSPDFEEGRGPRRRSAGAGTHADYGDARASRSRAASNSADTGTFADYEDARAPRSRGTSNAADTGTFVASRTASRAVTQPRRTRTSNPDTPADFALDLAAASVTRRGLWWAVPAAPAAVWLAGAAAELTLHDPGYVGAKAQAVGLLHATVHAFPVMAAALAASLLVALAGRTTSRNPSAGGLSGPHGPNDSDRPGRPGPTDRAARADRTAGTAQSAQTVRTDRAARTAETARPDRPDTNTPTRTTHPAPQP